MRAAKDRKRVTASTETTNVRIRQLKNGETNTNDDSGRLSVDITESIRKLYQFGNSSIKPTGSSKDTLDGTFRRFISIIENATKKTGPSFETPDGLEDTFQAVFLQDSEIQKGVTEILQEITRQSRLYQFCAIYVPLDMSAWIRENLNEPKKTRDALPYAIASPFDGRYIVEREEGHVNFSIYFVPDDEKVLDTHMIMMYECNPRFLYNETGRSSSTIDTGTHGSSMGSAGVISVWSPYWEFIEGRKEFIAATANEKRADKHRSVYVDYVMPPIPKELNMSEMTEQQIINRAAASMDHANPNNQQNPDLTYNQFIGHVYKMGIDAGFTNAAVPTDTTQDPDKYKRDARIQRLRPGETVNRNPHALLVRSSAELRKQYEMDIGLELNVPYSFYRMSEKGAYRKDDNVAEATMFATTVTNLQDEMKSIFYLLYQHTFGIIDDTMLDAYRKWERNIAFRPEDIEILKEIGIGDGGISESAVDLVNEPGLDRSRASYLVSEISQLTPFDIAMFSYMNSIDIPEESQRHFVNISFLPAPESSTDKLTDLIAVYNAGILQDEIKQAIRSRLNIPEAEDGEDNAAGDPNPRPTKRARKTKKPDNDNDKT